MNTTTCFSRLASAIKEEAATIKTYGSDEQTAKEHIDSAIDYVLESYCILGITRELYPAIMHYVRDAKVRDEDKDKVQEAFSELLTNAVVEHYNADSATIVTCALRTIQDEHKQENAGGKPQL